jgi:hypothetical protein
MSVFLWALLTGGYRLITIFLVLGKLRPISIRINVVIPDPVPPVNEWKIKKQSKHSHLRYSDVIDSIILSEIDFPCV